MQPGWSKEALLQKYSVRQSSKASLQNTDRSINEKSNYLKDRLNQNLIKSLNSIKSHYDKENSVPKATLKLTFNNT